MRLALCLAAMALLLASTATQLVWAAPVPGWKGWMGAVLDRMRGRLDRPVGNDDSELQHYAKKSLEKLLTETRRLLIEPVKRKGFWDGVRQSKLDRRLKALETNKPDRHKKILDVFRANPAAKKLRRVAEEVEDTLQGVWRTSDSPGLKEGETPTFRQHIETGTGAAIERLAKELENFEGQFLKREDFLERINDIKATHEVWVKLLEHYDATHSKLNEVAQILQQTKAKIKKLKAEGYNDGMSRRNTNHK